jgi:hypothetical protein
MRHGVPRLRQKGCSMSRIRALSQDLEPLREWFNDKSAFARIIAIQSPT